MNALAPIETAPTAGPHGEGHTVFAPQRQAEFLQNLQLFGNVRLACRAARISSQTAYRQRRASPALAQAWDAALLAARAHAEAALADRALNGVEEAVYYHGEEVARRRRYDSRLLLAHLARLDRLEEREEVAACLPVLDAVIDRLRDGETDIDSLLPQRKDPQDCAPCAPSCGEGPPAGPTETAARDPLALACTCVGAAHDGGGGAAHWRMGASGPEPVPNVGGEGPCCEAPRWPECRACPHYPAVERMLQEMEEAQEGVKSENAAS